jgi:pyrophosphatase PpaX
MQSTAFLFDLDGTLIDSIELLLRSMEHAFDGAARVPSRAQWTAGIGTPLRVQLAEWSDDDRMVDVLVERYRAFQDLHLESLTSVYPGVPAFLADLRMAGVRTAIVTSKGRGMTGRSLAHVGLAESFDTIVTYEDTERHKPGPEPVLLALERLGVPPARAVFVGDSPHDMHAGRAAGVATAAALWGPFSRQELEPASPTWWLGQVDDLRDIFGTFKPSSSGGHPIG